MRKISQQFDKCDDFGHEGVVLLGMGDQGQSPLALDYRRESLDNDDPKWSYDGRHYRREAE